MKPGNELFDAANNLKEAASQVSLAKVCAASYDSLLDPIVSEIAICYIAILSVAVAIEA